MAGASRSGLWTPGRGEPWLEGQCVWPESVSSIAFLSSAPPAVIASDAAPGARGTAPGSLPAAAKTAIPAATTSRTAASTSATSGSSRRTPSETLRMRMPRWGKRSGKRMACATCLPRILPSSMLALMSTTSASLASPR